MDATTLSDEFSFFSGFALWHASVYSHFFGHDMETV